jgi:hypothetical protein
LREKKEMKKKIFGIFVCTLFIATAFSTTVMAGDEENPEITDDTQDAFGNIDIKSVWFWEKSEEPGFLFVSMKINQPNLNKIQQTFAVFWEYNGIEYACGLFIGINLLGWESWSAGEYINRAPHGGPNYFEIDKGTYDIFTGVITWKIAKEIIGDPSPDDVLTKTWSNAFQRYGLLGLAGFSRPIIDTIFNLLFKKSLWDFAPNHSDEYGLDYTIQY